MSFANTLISLFGAILLLLLTLSGLLLIVAPALGRRVLQKTATFAGMFFVLLVALNALWQMLRSLNPLLLILGVIAISTLAFFVRERRLRGHARHGGPRHAERTPVMPHHISGEDE
jgi:hypothetical protein